MDGARATGTNAPVHINSDNPQALCSLPGVTPSIAEQIISWRSVKQFNTWAALQSAVNGVTPATVAAFRRDKLAVLRPLPARVRSAPVNINNADQHTLCQLPGVTQEMTAQIISKRFPKPFRTWAELQSAITGLTIAMIDTLRKNRLALLRPAPGSVPRPLSPTPSPDGSALALSPPPLAEVSPLEEEQLYSECSCP